MDLHRLFEAQKVLDERIIKERWLEGRDLLPNKILALQVELGELANEWRGFKHWSKDQKPRTEYPCQHCEGAGFIRTVNAQLECVVVECAACARGIAKAGNPLLEEYADCLHFILSIGNDTGKQRIIGIDFPNIGKVGNQEIVQTLNNLFMYASLMHEDDCYHPLIDHFFDLGYMLGFTWEQIEHAYWDKNRLNHERQAKGY